MHRWVDTFSELLETSTPKESEIIGAVDLFKNVSDGQLRDCCKWIKDIYNGFTEGEREKYAKSAEFEIAIKRN